MNWERIQLDSGASISMFLSSDREEGDGMKVKLHRTCLSLLHATTTHFKSLQKGMKVVAGVDSLITASIRLSETEDSTVRRVAGLAGLATWTSGKITSGVIPITTGS